MRHKYETSGIVLTRSPLGEANALITILTPTVGLVRARAQGVRKPGAKLASALATLAKSELVLVRGKEGWRVAGAVLDETWEGRRLSHDARTQATRVLGLLIRLIAGETQEASIYILVEKFLEVLSNLSPDEREAAELLVVLRVLAVLGFDAGEIPGAHDDFTSATLALVQQDRSGYIQRINHGIAVSGL